MERVASDLHGNNDHKETSSAGFCASRAKMNSYQVRIKAAGEKKYMLSDIDSNAPGNRSAPGLLKTRERVLPSVILNQLRQTDTVLDAIPKNSVRISLPENGTARDNVNSETPDSSASDISRSKAPQISSLASEDSADNAHRARSGNDRPVQKNDNQASRQKKLSRENPFSELDRFASLAMFKHRVDSAHKCVLRELQIKDDPVQSCLNMCRQLSKFGLINISGETDVSSQKVLANDSSIILEDMHSNDDVRWFFIFTSTF